MNNVTETEKEHYAQCIIDVEKASSHSIKSFLTIFCPANETAAMPFMQMINWVRNAAIKSPIICGEV